MAWVCIVDIKKGTSSLNTAKSNSRSILSDRLPDRAESLLLPNVSKIAALDEFFLV